MSRIGKQPVSLPDGVTVTVTDGVVTVKGPKGSLSRQLHSDISVAVQDNEVVCTINRQSKKASALWGTVRAHIANMVEGVTQGFDKRLELHGVGYRAKLKGKNLELSLGYSHPVTVAAPEGISFAVEQEVITIQGIDKEVVGQVAADLRKLRKPEPYKGKGVRYQGENVRRKMGKVVGSGGGE